MRKKKIVHAIPLTGGMNTFPGDLITPTSVGKNTTNIQCLLLDKISHHHSQFASNIT